MKTLFQTDEAWSSLILRVMLGIVMLPHGAHKLLGWFGGFGFAGTMGFFTDKMHLPWIFFFSSRRRHTRYWRDWSSDVCSSDLICGPCSCRVRRSTTPSVPLSSPAMKARRF